jgi:hypothetical protein
MDLVREAVEKELAPERQAPAHQALLTFLQTN